jgi:anti-anti-sigma regulatory factor
MDPKMMQVSETDALRLEGSLTIGRAVELKELLRDALRNGNEIILDLGSATEVDLSFLQLLCSAHRTALRMSKHLILKPERSAASRKVVRETGYLRTLGCRQAPHKSCLWKEGWEA